MLSAVNSAKLSAQSPPCRRNASPRDGLGELGLQLARFAGEDERRIGRELRLDGPQLGLVGIVGHLHPRTLPPVGFLPLAHRRHSVSALGGPLIGEDGRKENAQNRRARAGLRPDGQRLDPARQTCFRHGASPKGEPVGHSTASCRRRGHRGRGRAASSSSCWTTSRSSLLERGRGAAHRQPHVGAHALRLEGDRRRRAAASPARPGSRFELDSDLEEVSRDDTILLCGGLDVARRRRSGCLNWLRREARHGAPIGGLCTASYALAQGRTSRRPAARRSTGRTTTASSRNSRRST